MDSEKVSGAVMVSGQQVIEEFKAIVREDRITTKKRFWYTFAPGALGLVIICIAVLMDKGIINFLYTVGMGIGIFSALVGLCFVLSSYD